MKNLIFKTFCIIALCGIVLCGTIRAEEYTVDPTLEPDPIPRFNPRSEITAPAVILPSQKPEFDENSLVLPGDIPIIPPQLIRNDSGQLILVQHVARSQPTPRPQPGTQANARPQPGTPANTRSQPNQANARNQGQTPQPQHQPIPELPLLREFDAMSDTERMAALRRAMETVLIANTRRGMNTRENTPNDVLLMALAHGADARVFQPNPAHNPRDRNAANVPAGNYIYSIGALAWNTPCNGKTLLRNDGRRVIARVGHGFQNQPASFAALLAMSNILPDYELRVGGGSFTIADLIESERRGVSRGMNMSMALVALSFYGNPNDQWQNDFGETWNIERMVTGELNRPLNQGTSEVTDWLLGLTAAVKLFESENIPIRGPMALAKRQLQVYQDFVMSIQNDRHLWHPKFFLYKGFNPNAFETMFSSGHILRWLVFSLPDNELRDPQVVRTVMSLTTTVNRVRPETMANNMTARQLESLAVSLHALSIYYQRVFGEDPPVRTPPSRSVAAM